MPQSRCSCRLTDLLRRLGAAAASAAMLLIATAVLSAQQPYDPASTGSSSQQTSTSPSADPPSRIARLSVMDGDVSVEPASVEQFSPAELNYPLTTGDRLWADNHSVAEVEAGQLAVRMGELTDLTLTAMTDTQAQFGLGQGSVHLRSYALQSGTTTELDTPNVAVTVLVAGDVRVDVEPDSDTTIVTLLSGEVEIDGNGLQQRLRAGQRVQLTGTDPVVAEWLEDTSGDGLDSFSADRDGAYQRAENAEQAYVSPETVGGAELADYGTWTDDETYGVVWYPTGVVAGWQPYCYGHWTWVAPWGWTWVEREPWGFAPFHYGRWAQLNGRWGWIPGPPVVHPVYSPGLVVFVAAGNGIAAWFPLGPHEPYAPWYRSSVLYRNRVNVSNLYSRNSSEIRAIYRTGNREIYAEPLSAQQRFANRSIATVAMPQASFAGGRTASASLLRLDADRLSRAPVLPHPVVTTEPSIVAPSMARALPPRVSRPTLASRRDTAVHAGTPGAAQGAGSVMQGPPAAVDRRGGNVPSVQPARTLPPYVVTPDQPARVEQYGRPGRTRADGAPSRGNNTSPPARPPESQSPNPGMMIEGGVQPPHPPRGTERLPTGDIGPRQEPPPGAPAERPLYDRAVPPPARPNFDQQRDAIQRSDPGRPPSPQQLDAGRESRPPGPQGREAAPHAAPESRSAAPPPPENVPSPAPRSDNRKH